MESALKKEVLPFLNERQRKRVEEIEGELKRYSSGIPDPDSTEALQAELDGLIAAECPLTGSLMVDSIDKPFEDSEEIGDVMTMT